MRARDYISEVKNWNLNKKFLSKNAVMLWNIFRKNKEVLQKNLKMGIMQPLRATNLLCKSAQRSVCSVQISIFSDVLGEPIQMSL